ncbi:MAG: glycosyltransferase [Ginsengibacter sp.]
MPQQLKVSWLLLYSRLESIIVDDGSTNGTVNIAKRFCGKRSPYKNIR